jgi:peptide chain release factor 1
MEAMTTINDLKQEYAELTRALAEPQRLTPGAYGDIAARYAVLQELLARTEETERLRKDVLEHRRLAQEETDADVRRLAEDELPALEERLARAEDELRRALLPQDPHAGKDVILEIRAGAGGDEAALFARILFAMYSRYAERRGWTVHLVSESHSDLGGYKEIVVEIGGKDVYGTLMNESGVHRIQRIPVTEKSGRVHTSTATVAVLPQAEDVDIAIRPEDLRIDTFRAGGHGGQKVQKTDSAVRITHLPTGLVVQCQDERSQQKNKERALRVLRSRLLVQQLESKAHAERTSRRAQIGTGDRSEKIRTYNVPQDRLTDHRVKLSWHGLDGIFAGDLDEIIDAVRRAREAAQLDSAG